MSQSTIKLVDFNESDDEVVFVLQAASTEQLANEITEYFRSREYRLESGTALNGIWGTGNAFLRAMFGGMIKRHKFQLTWRYVCMASGLSERSTLSNRKASPPVNRMFDELPMMIGTPFRDCNATRVGEK